MPNLDLPILVVDDAKFSSMVVSRTLRNAGYRDVRIANNARTALQQMEQRPVSVLIADWLMPDMDGLELTDQVRQQDEQNNHYTYVILLTARESAEALPGRRPAGHPHGPGYGTVRAPGPGGRLRNPPLHRNGTHGRDRGLNPERRTIGNTVTQITHRHPGSNLTLWIQAVSPMAEGPSRTSAA